MPKEIKKKRGGPRPGAGRPRLSEAQLKQRRDAARHAGRRPNSVLPPVASPEPRLIAGSKINAVDVGELARDGASVEIITAYLRIPPALMHDPAFLAEFEAEVRFGVAAKEVDLLRERKAHAASGKVGATLYALRNLASDRNNQAAPIDRNAVAEVDSILSRFRRQ